MKRTSWFSWFVIIMGAGMVTIGVLTGRIEKKEFEEIGADYVLKEATEICNILSCR